jgi:hypothetical protein
MQMIPDRTEARALARRRQSAQLTDPEWIATIRTLTGMLWTTAPTPADPITATKGPLR